MYKCTHTHTYHLPCLCVCVERERESMCKITYTRGSMTRVSIFMITAIAHHQYMYNLPIATARFHLPSSFLPWSLMLF